MLNRKERVSGLRPTQFKTTSSLRQEMLSRASVVTQHSESTVGAMRVVATGVCKGACSQFCWPYNLTTEYRHCGYGEPLVFIH